MLKNSNLNKERKLLFSVTLEDCRVDTFRSGGKGGQNQNKRDTGVRITHLDSGAVGEARDNRTQELNKRAAFRRMYQSDKFKAWQKLEAARCSGWNIDAEVNKALNPKNIKVDIKDEEGRWVDAKDKVLE